MQSTYSTGLVWFRRDLRTSDTPALALALQSCAQVHCVFVFDRSILDTLPRADRRVEFIQASLVELHAELRALSGKAAGGLIVRHAVAADEIPRLAASLKANAVFAAHDYEPASLARDAIVQTALSADGVAWVGVKDHVIFERREVLTQTGKPYGVFTPYLRAWLGAMGTQGPARHDSQSHGERLAVRPSGLDAPVPSLADIGFESTNLRALGIAPGASGAQAMLEDFLPRMDAYDETRNFPAVKGPSYLGVHLRFGTVSVRQLVALALPRHQDGNKGASVWLAELGWRDFYFQILANFPQVATGAFKPEYNAITWEHGAHAHALFDAWCQGRTGYPLVDAAMAQINQTGYMHNRLRMVVASFLVKDLGIDWRWGERYFAEHLNDFDLSANNGGWQWASSTGCDAQPYFRIFNPVSQSEKFDPEGKFIRRYLPQLAALPNAALHAPWAAKPMELAAAGFSLGRDYPAPIVMHDEARAKTLLRYAVVKKSAL
ncbi:MAG: deoxyribodipyrimidine photo-lyase [Betaproteobacteria bacterium]